MERQSTLQKLVSAPLRLLIPSLLLLIAITYSNTLYSPFVLDDLHSFVEEPKVFVQDFSTESLNKLASTVFGKARLIPLITFAVDHHFFSGSIAQYHITNIAVHLLTTVALFLLIQGMLQTQGGSRVVTFLSPNHFCFFVCALWALNPVQTNVVTYLVQRMTSLAALFYILALALYIFGRIRQGSVRKSLLFLGFVLCAMCAFLSKQISATLPAAVLLVEFMFISPGLSGKILRSLRWRHWLLLTIAILLLLPFLERPWDYVTTNYGHRHFTLIERLLTESRVVVYYISLLILPLPGRMNLEHDFPLSRSLTSPPTTVIAILLLLTIIIFAICIRKRYPLIAFGVFFFFLNLLIESTVIPLELVFEHRLYLPSVGFFLALMGVADVLLKNISMRHRFAELRQIFFLMMIIILSMSAVLTTLRNNDWRDTLALYHDCVQKSPEKPRVYVNYGLALGQRGRYEESVLNLEKAIELGRPGYESYLRAANNILACFVEQEDYNEVIKKGEKFLKEMPQGIDISALPKLLYHLGLAYKMTGRFVDAYYAYESAIKLEERESNGYLVVRIQELLDAAYNNEAARKELFLGEADEEKEIAILLRMTRLLLEIRDYEKAKRCIDFILINDAENRKAQGYLQRYHLEMTKNKLQAVQSDYKNHRAYKENKSYRIYIALSDFILNYYSPLNGFAEWLLYKAEEEEPDDPFASLFLGRLYLKKGGLDLALKTLERAIQINPDFFPLLELASDCYLTKEELNKVVTVREYMLDLYPNHKKWKYSQKLISKIEKEQKKEKT